MLSLYLTQLYHVISVSDSVISSYRSVWLSFIILSPYFSVVSEVTLSPQTAALVEQLNQSQLLSALANMKELEIKYNRLLEKVGQL